MRESRDYLELSYYSIQAFGNDGKLDENELDKLIKIAVKDGKIDENETRVLSNICSRLKGNELSFSMKKKIEEVEERYEVAILSKES